MARDNGQRGSYRHADSPPQEAKTKTDTMPSKEQVSTPVRDAIRSPETDSPGILGSVRRLFHESPEMVTRFFQRDRTPNLISSPLAQEAQTTATVTLISSPLTQDIESTTTVVQSPILKSPERRSLIASPDGYFDSPSDSFNEKYPIMGIPGSMPPSRLATKALMRDEPSFGQTLILVGFSGMCFFSFWWLIITGVRDVIMGVSGAMVAFISYFIGA